MTGPPDVAPAQLSHARAPRRSLRYRSGDSGSGCGKKEEVLKSKLKSASGETAAIFMDSTVPWASART